MRVLQCLLRSLWLTSPCISSFAIAISRVDSNRGDLIATLSDLNLLLAKMTSNNPQSALSASCSEFEPQYASYLSSKWEASVTLAPSREGSLLKLPYGLIRGS